MKFKVLISLLLVGCVILFGFIFLIVKVKQQKEDRKQLIDEYLSRKDSPPPLIPRTEEIPDEIRQKFAAVPAIPEKSGIIAELVQGGSPETVEFSPTNPYLVVSRTYDNNAEDDIRLWDINNPVTPLAVFRGDSVSFSPDGKILAICDFGNIDGSVKLWDIAKEQFITSLRVVARDAVFSPDNKLLALTSSGLLLWDVSNLTAPVEAINLKRKNTEEEHTFSANGKLMATVESITDTVNIWEINGDQAAIKKNDINMIGGKVGWIEAMAFLPDPKNPILAIADNDEDIRLYYPPDWENYNTIPAGNVYDLAFTPDGKTIISGGSNELEIWSVENGNRIASIEGYSGWMKCVDVSADGKFVAASGNDGVIRVWDIANYLSKKQETPQDIVVPIYFLPTNRLPQTDIPEKIDTILRDLQTFFADEIQRHGFGRKTFDFEKNSDGAAKVYLFEGKTTDEYYDKYTSSRVLDEIEQHFESFNKCYFIIVDKSIEKASNKNRYTFSELENIRKSIQDMELSLRDYIFRRQGGHIVVRTPLNGYSKHALAAKFGDAFGLNRDYRHPSYLMSDGRQSKHLSKSSAAWLSRSRFFNTEMTFFDDKTLIETLSLSRGKARFKVEDADGIYQVRLLVIPINKNHPPGFQMKIDPAQNQTKWEKSYKGRSYTLHDALTLQGEKKATVELDYPKFVDNLIKLHVIDGYGNRVHVIKRINTSFLRRILNQRGN